MNKKGFPVSIMAYICQCSTNTLRNYDAEGLLPAHRTETNHRYYLPEDVEKFNQIRKNTIGTTDMSIGEFAERLNLTREYLINLDESGLFKANRTKGGKRCYPQDSVTKFMHHCTLNDINTEHITEIQRIYLLSEVARMLHIAPVTLRSWNKSGKYSANLLPTKKKQYFYTDYDMPFLSKLTKDHFATL